MTLGDISISLLIDDKQFKSSIQNAFKSTSDVGKNFDTLGNNQGFTKLKESINKTTQELGKLNQESAKTPNTIQGLKDKVSTLNKELENVSIGSKRFKELKDEIAKTNQELSKATGSSGLGKMKEMLGSGLGTLGVSLGLGLMAKSATEAAIKYEQLGVVFKTMLGSKEKADEMLGKLSKFAEETPFTDEEVNKGARSLLAMGYSADELLDRMKSLGNLASAAQIPFDELSSIIGKMKSGGLIQGDELDQLADRIPIIKLLATEMGVAEAQVKKMGSEGKISFDILQSAIEKSYGAGGQFGNLMDEMSQTAGGKISTILSKIDVMMREIGFAILEAIAPIIEGVMSLTGALTPVIKFISSIIKEIIQGFKLVFGVLISLLPSFDGIGNSMKGIVEPFRKFLVYALGMAAFIGTGIAIKMGIIAISVAIKTQLIPSILRMHAFLLANPFYLVVAAIVAGIALIMTTIDYMINHWETFETELEIIGESIDGIINVFTELGEAIMNAFSSDSTGDAKKDMNELGQKIDWVGTMFKVLGKGIAAVMNNISFVIQYVITYILGIFNILGSLWNLIKALFTFDAATIASALNGVYNAFVNLFSKLWGLAKNWASNVWKMIKGALSGDMVVNFDAGVTGGKKDDTKQSGGVKPPKPPPTGGAKGKEQDFASDKKLVEEWYKQNPIVAELTTDLKYQDLGRIKKDLTSFVNDMSKAGQKITFGIKDVKGIKDVEQARDVIQKIIDSKIGLKDYDSVIKNVFNNFQPKTLAEMASKQRLLNKEMDGGSSSANDLKNKISNLQNELRKAKSKTDKIDIEMRLNVAKKDLERIEKGEITPEISAVVKLKEAENTQDEIRNLIKQADVIIREGLSTKMLIEAKIKLNQAEIDSEINNIRKNFIDLSNDIDFKVKINDEQINQITTEIRSLDLESELKIKASKEITQAEINGIVNSIQVDSIELEMDLSKVNAEYDATLKNMETKFGKNQFTSQMMDIGKEIESYGKRIAELEKPGPIGDFTVIDTAKLAAQLNFYSSMIEKMKGGVIQFYDMQTSQEKNSLAKLKQNNEFALAVWNKYFDSLIEAANAAYDALDAQLKEEERLEEESLKIRAKLDDEHKKKREQAEWEHQQKLEQIKKEFELRAQLAKDEYAQKEKERLDALMQAELDKLNLEFENKLLYIEQNSATDEEEQINKELTIADHEARKAEIQTGYKDLLAQNIEGKNTEIDEKEKNRKMDYADWEKMFDETKIAEDQTSNLTLDEYEKLRQKKLADEERANQLAKEQFDIELERRKEERANKRQEAENARDEATKKAEEEKAKAKKLTALIEYMAGFAVFQAEQRGKLAGVQMQFALLAMNSVAGIAAAFATGALPGAIIGGIVAGTLLALGAGVMATSMSMIQSAQYPPFLAFAQGGQVPGSGGIDSVPSMLTPGEIVIPEKNFQDISSSLQPANNMNSNVNKYYLIENGRESELNENEFNRRVDTRLNYVISNVR